MIFAQGFMLGVGVGIIFASSIVLLALFAIEDAHTEESARRATRASTPTPKPRSLDVN